MKYIWILNKRNKRTKMLNIIISRFWKIIFSILALTESLFLILKGYLCYKTIFCHTVALDAQLMSFFIWRKNYALFSRYLDFCFLRNQQISKSVTSSYALLHNGSYTFAYFFWILSAIKKIWWNTNVLCQKRF